MDKWHRLSKLTFQSELGPYIPDAIAELCCSKHEEAKVEVDIKVKIEQPEVIDLTLDEDGILHAPQFPAPESRIPVEPDLTIFAEDESKMTLRQLLECLSVDEINAVAKDLKLKYPQSVSFLAFVDSLKHDWSGYI